MANQLFYKSFLMIVFSSGLYAVSGVEQPKFYSLQESFDLLREKQNQLIDSLDSIKQQFTIPVSNVLMKIVPQVEYHIEKNDVTDESFLHTTIHVNAAKKACFLGVVTYVILADGIKKLSKRNLLNKAKPLAFILPSFLGYNYFIESNS